MARADIHRVYFTTSLYAVSRENIAHKIESRMLDQHIHDAICEIVKHGTCLFQESLFFDFPIHCVCLVKGNITHETCET